MFDYRNLIYICCSSNLHSITGTDFLCTGTCRKEWKEIQNGASGNDSGTCQRDGEDMERIFDETHNADVANALAILEANEHTIYDPPAVFDSNKSEILLSTENKLKEIYEVFPNEGKVVLGYSYLVSWNYVTWLDFPRPIDEELIPLFKKWIRKFPENKLELMEYYSFILFEKWLYMDSLDNISEANKIYYEIKAIADELSKDYADNQVTQMLSMGIVRKL